MTHISVWCVCVCVCDVCAFLFSSGQSTPYSPEGAALGGYGLDVQSHLGLRTAGENSFHKATQPKQCSGVD